MCFCSPPPCRGDASRCSLRALSWPRGQPRTGPEERKKCGEDSWETFESTEKLSPFSRILTTSVCTVKVKHPCLSRRFDIQPFLFTDSVSPLANLPPQSRRRTQPGRGVCVRSCLRGRWQLRSPPGSGRRANGLSDRPSSERSDPPYPSETERLLGKRDTQPGVFHSEFFHMAKYAPSVAACFVIFAIL